MIRLATPNDGQGCLEIYGYYISHTAITFEITIPSIEDFSKRMAKKLETHPWLVCEKDGQIVGYAYSNAYRVRWAYQWSVECTVYVHKDFRGRKIGKGLYTALLGLLKLQGFQNVYAGIVPPNVGSFGLHQKMGFRRIGSYDKVGFKNGEWHDVVWLSLDLGTHPNQPISTLGMETAQLLPEWQASIAAGNALLQI